MSFPPMQVLPKIWQGIADFQSRDWTEIHLQTKSWLQKQQSYLIYMLTCTNCGKQYVGETSRTFGERCSEHLRDIRYTRDPSLAPPSWLLKEPTPVGKHWGQTSHTIEELKINILALIHRDPKDPATKLYRQHLEFQWIHKLRTMVPFGINVKIDDPLFSGW